MWWPRAPKSHEMLIIVRLQTKLWYHMHDFTHCSKWLHSLFWPTIGWPFGRRIYIKISWNVGSLFSKKLFRWRISVSREARSTGKEYCHLPTQGHLTQCAAPIALTEQLLKLQALAEVIFISSEPFILDSSALFMHCLLVTHWILGCVAATT